METQVLRRSFVKVDGLVKIENIMINSVESRFTLRLSVKLKGKKNWKTKEVSGVVTKKLMNWFTVKTKEYVKGIDSEGNELLIETGKMKTCFEKYLDRMETPFVGGVLKTLTFSCDNKSEIYDDCPFRITEYLDGESVLSLVNDYPKRKREWLDVETGEVRTSYFKRTYTDSDGNVREKFISKSHFVRYVYQAEVSYES